MLTDKTKLVVSNLLLAINEQRDAHNQPVRANGFVALAAAREARQQRLAAAEINLDNAIAKAKLILNGDAG